MLQFMGSQGVGHDLVTEQQLIVVNVSFRYTRTYIYMFFFGFFSLIVTTGY